MRITFQKNKTLRYHTKFQSYRVLKFLSVAKNNHVNFGNTKMRLKITFTDEITT